MSKAEVTSKNTVGLPQRCNGYRFDSSAADAGLVLVCGSGPGLWVWSLYVDLVPGLGLVLVCGSDPGLWVWSLVGKLKPHMPPSQKTKREAIL